MTIKQQILKLSKKLGVWVTGKYDQADRRKLRYIELDIQDHVGGHFKANGCRHLSIELSDDESAAVGWSRALAALKQGLK